jgi:ammonia channel protein AmtB
VGVLAGGLRVTDEQEVEGLDTVSHEESAYND